MAAHLTCQEFVELVTADLDDAMDAETKERFEDHLLLCPGCVTYVDQFRTTIEQLGEIDPPTFPADADAKLMDAFGPWPR
jgi:hypothetical protein